MNAAADEPAGVLVTKEEHQALHDQQPAGVFVRPYDVPPTYADGISLPRCTACSRPALSPNAIEEIRNVLHRLASPHGKLSRADAIQLAEHGLAQLVKQ